MIKQILHFAPRRFILTVIALITLQQASGALATFAIARCAEAISNPNVLIRYLLIFFGASLLPSLIAVVIKRVEARGFLRTYLAFLSERFDADYGQPGRWVQKKNREKYLTAIGPEAEQYLVAVTFSYLDLYGYALNIVLNALVISSVIDVRFAAAYVVAMVASGATYILRRGKTDRLITLEQTGRMDFSSLVLKAWDHVMLKNKSVHERYRAKLHSNYQELSGRSARAMTFSESTIFLLNLVTSVPVYAVTLYLVWSHAGDATLLAALLATMPRQLALLTTFRSFYQQMTNLNIFAARFKAARENSTLDAVNLETLVAIEKITVNGQKFDSVAAVIDFIGRQKVGRLVIRGENGAGKSSLMLHLHTILPKSFYLPPAADLDLGHSAADRSTGERMVQHVRAVLDVAEDVVLLDEWDANLDSDFLNVVDDLIEASAMRRIVIEIRHR